ncbi:hypothetical protein HY631_03130 [Candidatus Uhrbacteria bacterium]|nr:hypothetical protein [Candidatus Uhrbacteria bacterium]
MRLFLVGAGLIVAIIPVGMILLLLDVQPGVTSFMIIVIAGIAFFLQMYGVFGMKIANDRALEQMRARHQAKFAQASRLPATEAIALLLKQNDD